MARYIGARYVPIMAGDWDNTKEYEALSVVQYQGDSYTSKMYVPVGVDIANTQYWVKTGTFNQQVAAMGSRIDALQTAYDGQFDDINDDITDLTHDINGVENSVTTLNTRVDNCLPTSFVTSDLPTIIKNAFFTERKGVVFNNVPAKGVRSGTVDAAKTGAKFLGVVGFYTGNSNFIAGGAIASQGTTVVAKIYNTGTATDSAEVEVMCLYVANTL